MLFIVHVWRLTSSHKVYISWTLNMHETYACKWIWKTSGTYNILNMHLHMFATSTASRMNSRNIMKLKKSPVHKMKRKIIIFAAPSLEPEFCLFSSVSCSFSFFPQLDESSIEINIQFEWRIKHNAIVATDNVPNSQCWFHRHAIYL